MKQSWTIPAGGDPTLQDCDEAALIAQGYTRYRIVFSRGGGPGDEGFIYAQRSLGDPDITPACKALFGDEPGVYQLFGPGGHLLQP